MTFARAAEDYKSFITSNVLGGCNVTDKGVLDISHDIGMVFDVTNDTNIPIVATTVDITLTDDDTNYLYWSAGSSLAVKLTVPTGNEVLVATIITAAVDISSITPAGFDPANLTNLTTRPLFLLKDDTDEEFYAEAVIKITDENLLGFENSFAIRKENYRLVLEITVDSTTSITIKDLIAEIDAKNKTNNALQTREYYYTMTYAWNSSYLEGIINLIIICKRRAIL